MHLGVCIVNKNIPIFLTLSSLPGGFFNSFNKLKLLGINFSPKTRTKAHILLYISYSETASVKISFALFFKNFIFKSSIFFLNFESLTKPPFFHNQGILFFFLHAFK